MSLLYIALLSANHTCRALVQNALFKFTRDILSDDLYSEIFIKDSKSSLTSESKLMSLRVLLEGGDFDCKIQIL